MSIDPLWSIGHSGTYSVSGFWTVAFSFPFSGGQVEVEAASIATGATIMGVALLTLAIVLSLRVGDATKKMTRRE